ncbi:MAG: hypothetical protein IK032_05390, partial [Bacteroidales bacterium]|nr:hypothetical protein [Bacteroidales bacterium]
IQGTSIDIFADLLTRVCIKTFGLSDSWENNLHSIPDKIVNQCQRLIVAYKNPNENRHDFVGKSTRFIKYLRYSKFFRFVFSRSIFANYYSFFRKNSNGHIDVKSENSE